MGHLSFTEILDTSLKVSWQEPLEKNGIITGKSPCVPKRKRGVRPNREMGVVAPEEPADSVGTCLRLPRGDGPGGSGQGLVPAPGPCRRSPAPAWAAAPEFGDSPPPVTLAKLCSL